MNAPPPWPQRAAAAGPGGAPAGLALRGRLYYRARHRLHGSRARDRHERHGARAVAARAARTAAGEVPGCVTREQMWHRGAKPTRVCLLPCLLGQAYRRGWADAAEHALHHTASHCQQVCDCQRPTWRQAKAPEPQPASERRLRRAAPS